jgi:hypothetical protein
MRLIGNEPHKIFNSVEQAEKMIATMQFEDGETKINVDPKGSGRCFVEVLDLENGDVIGRI